MRFHVPALIIGVATAFLFGRMVSAQIDLLRGPPGCVPVAERQTERGCYLLISDNLRKLPTGPLYWHIASFATRVQAENSKGSYSTVVEALGKVWLFTIGSESWHGGGERVATLGPFEVDAGLEYTATYAEAIMLPGATTTIHRHAGPELIHVLQGEECMETPDGKQTGRPGGKPVIVAANVPHKLTVTGAVERRALALVLHDTREPWVNRAHDHVWQEKGLCKAVE